MFQCFTNRGGFVCLGSWAILQQRLPGRVYRKRFSFTRGLKHSIAAISSWSLGAFFGLAFAWQYCACSILSLASVVYRLLRMKHGSSEPAVSNMTRPQSLLNERKPPSKSGPYPHNIHCKRLQNAQVRSKGNGVVTSHWQHQV